MEILAACVGCKTESNKRTKKTNKNSDIDNSMVVSRGKGLVAVRGKGSQLNGEGRWSDCGWWAHNAMYRSCVTEMYT